MAIHQGSYGWEAEQLAKAMLLDHSTAQTRHMDSLISEELSRAIDNTNRVYTLSHVPDGRIFLLWTGGILRREPNHYRRVGLGKNIILVDPLTSDVRHTDFPPVALYTWNPLVPEFGFDPAIMGRGWWVKYRTRRTEDRDDFPTRRRMALLGVAP